MGLKEFFLSLPLIDQVPITQFYVPGYTESLKLYSDVRVVLSNDWLQGVPHDLQDYFYKVGFPCYFVPIFTGRSCFGFVTKGSGKFTPRFATNTLLPGCERLKGGETVVFVEGFKDSYLPMLSCGDLPVVVLPMLTAVPSKDLLSLLGQQGCKVVLVPDNDDYAGDHLARFYELCGKTGAHGFQYRLSMVEDFGDFFNPDLRGAALREAKKLRGFLSKLVAGEILAYENAQTGGGV
jgi:hypothetical protein